MKITSKIFIVFALICFKASAAFGQDCESLLRRAAELVSQKKYCEAREYYIRYKNCNADADVSTEIAMCERFCRILSTESGEDAPVTGLEGNSASSRNSASRSVEGGSKYGLSQNERVKLGVNGGVQVPMGDFGRIAKIYFGGNISAEYLVFPKIGIGLNAGYYAYELEMVGKGYKELPSLIPVTLAGKFYPLTKSIRPYIGVEAGLYIVGIKVTFDGKSDSISDSFFGVAPVAGFQFGLSNAVSLDVNAKYSRVFTKEEPTDFLGCNVGIVFSFGK